MKKAFLMLACLLLAFPVFADDITFKGGYTKMSMKDGAKEITLGGGGEVHTGSLDLTAKSIVLSGPDYDNVQCTGNVTVIDREKGLTVKSPSITYVRSTRLITIQSWVEIDDTGNEVSASAGGLFYDMDKGIMTMQSHVRLLRAASKGIMTCRCDEMVYDRNNKKLQLTGNAVVDWDGDTYQAHAISVNLDSEEIVMEGAIQGTVHG